MSAYRLVGFFAISVLVTVFCANAGAQARTAQNPALVIEQPSTHADISDRTHPTLPPLSTRIDHCLQAQTHVRPSFVDGHLASLTALNQNSPFVLASQNTLLTQRTSVESRHWHRRVFVLSPVTTQNHSHHSAWSSRFALTTGVFTPSA